MKPTLAVPALLLCSFAPAQFFVRNAGTQPAHATDQLVYDFVRSRSVVLNDTGTWEFDGLRWHGVTTAQLPPARYEHAMTFDGSRVLLYGGQSAASISAPALGDFWAYDGVHWTQIAQGANNPGLRRAAAIAHDDARGKLVLYGGTDMVGGFPNDTWEWDGTSWTHVSVASPGPRVWHRMVYDPLRSRIVMCGGAFFPTSYQDTWEYDGSSWVMTNPNQLPPRLDHGLVYDFGLQRVVLVGGQNPVPMGGIAYSYDAAMSQWTSLTVQNAPGEYLQTGAAYDIAHAHTIVLTKAAVTGDSELKTFLFESSGALTASCTPFGTGCPGGPTMVGGRPGPGVVPQLAALTGSRPVRNSQFALQLTGLGNGTFATLSAGLDNTNWNGHSLPYDLAPVGLPGCMLRIDPTVTVPMATSAPGRLEYLLSIPGDPSLTGLRFYEQALLFDGTAPGGIGAVSNACTLIVQ